jgi:hypothetical protein
MSLLAIIDYSLIVIFFIGIAGLLLMFVHADQPSVAPAILPSPREEPAPYVFLAVLFLLFIVLAILTQKEQGQGAASG